MTILTTRTRFGRYVFAIGGNPDAADLSGINTKWVTVKIFALMGTLSGLAAVISSARLNSATNNLGTLDELYVIAAAVIGGTSFSGGIGTIYGAILARIGHAVPANRHVADWLLMPPSSKWLSAAFWWQRFGWIQSTAAGLRFRGAGLWISKPRLVEMKNIELAFGGVKAVDDVSIDLYAGEVVGLLGHNGAGKSTLIKVLSVAYKADGGEIFVSGEKAIINNPRDARKYNIETIYQTLALADNLDAASNLFLGRELVTKMGMVDDVAMEAETRKIMGRLNPNFTKFSAPVSALSGGQRQSVAITRAVYFNARISDHGRTHSRPGPTRNRNGGRTDPPVKG